MGGEHAFVCPTCRCEVGLGAYKVLVVVDACAYYIADLFEHCGCVVPVICLFESKKGARQSGERVLEQLREGIPLFTLPLISQSHATYVTE